MILVSYCGNMFRSFFRPSSGQRTFRSFFRPSSGQRTFRSFFRPSSGQLTFRSFFRPSSDQRTFRFFFRPSSGQRTFRSFFRPSSGQRTFRSFFRNWQTVSSSIMTTLRVTHRFLYGNFCQIKILRCVLIHIIHRIWHRATSDSSPKSK